MQLEFIDWIVVVAYGKPEIELAMKGQRLAHAELIGTYQKGDQ
jgi:hypothetical protein